MAEQYFWYEGPATNGQRVENLTYQEAMELEKQEKELLKQQQADAAIAPALNKEISNYAKREGITQDSMFPQQNNTAMSQIPAEADPIISSLDNIKSSKEDTTELEAVLNNIPAPQTTLSGMDSGTRPQQTQQGTGSLQTLLDKLDPDIARALIFEYRNNPQKMTPSKLYAEIRKTLDEQAKIKQQQAAEEFTSDQAIRQKAPELESQERRTEMQGEAQRDVAKINAYSRSNESSFENARQQQAALRTAEFSEKEKEMIGAVEEGKIFMTDLVNVFSKNKYGNPINAVSEFGASIPLAGKFIAPKTKKYQNQKEVISETWLRAATGAAAPDPEVKRYASFLPDPSDPPEVAQNRLDTFFTKISARAQGRAKAIELEGLGLEKRGFIDLANIKYTQANTIRTMITSARNEIPKIYTNKEQSNQSTVQPTGTQQPSVETPQIDPQMRALAQQALNDPEATPQEKEQARKLLGL